MPEGDTIHTVARALAPRLEGRALVGVRLRGDPTLDLAGRVVERVEARGKHLFVTVAGGLVLRSHLGMHGSWHRYRPGEPWQKPARHAALVLETERDVLVCFHAAEVECLRAGGARARAAAARVGPDLAGDAQPDLDDVVRRARALLAPDDPVVDALMVQRVAGGIGNVHKSEALFAERVDPRAPLGSLDDATLRRLYARARGNLRANLGGGPRVTRDDGGGALWVYRKAGRPCPRCATAIATARIGRGRRSTYWCPRCQAR